MPDTSNKTTSFENFGVKLVKARWSWSGSSEDASVLALVLWQDRIKGKNGDVSYATPRIPTANCAADLAKASARAS